METQLLQDVNLGNKLLLLFPFPASQIWFDLCACEFSLVEIIWEDLQCHFSTFDSNGFSSKAKNVVFYIRQSLSHYQKFQQVTRSSILVCSVLVNSDILTANYGVKQSQFTKPTSEPRARNPEDSNEFFDSAIWGWLLQYQCS